ERKKLRAILNELNPPKGMGYIIRTAGADRSRTELVRDLNYLLNLWKAITNRVRNVKSPVAIYQESDLVMRTIRDHLVDEIEEVIVDSVEAYQSAMAFLKEVMPGFAERLRLYNSPKPLFHEYKIEDQVDRLYDRTVPLPSGGSIMIDQTEALVAIDVNSGKSKDKDNLEATALQTNLEAAREICKQLRLRDMGGVICCDFIDLREDRHRQKIENLMRERLSEDRARTRVARMSRFCILELTRQRVRMSIRKIHYHTCSVCNGSGSIKTVQSMALWTVRHLRNKVTAAKAPKKLEVRLHPDVVNRLNQKHAADLKTIENLSGHKLLVKTDRGLKVEEIKFR
ncbi:MAG: ribonuclease E/G, partial [Planctomycetota bacterium]